MLFKDGCYSFGALILWFCGVKIMLETSFCFWCFSIENFQGCHFAKIENVIFLANVVHLTGEIQP